MLPKVGLAKWLAAAIVPATKGRGEDLLEDVARYRSRAAEMRQLAERARDSVTRAEFLRLAAEYETLAERAQSGLTAGGGKVGG